MLKWVVIAWICNTLEAPQWILNACIIGLVCSTVSLGVSLVNLGKELK